MKNKINNICKRKNKNNKHKNSINKNVRIIIIGIFFILFAPVVIVQVVNAELYYEVGLNYDKGDLNITFINKTFIEDPLPFWGENEIRLVDEKNNIIEKNVFEIYNYYLYDEIDIEANVIVDGGMVILDNANFSVLVPYNEMGKKIIILDENNTIKDEKIITPKKSIKKFSDAIIRDIGIYVVVIFLIIIIIYFAYRNQKMRIKILNKFKIRQF